MTKQANQSPTLFTAKVNTALSIVGVLVLSNEVLSVTEISKRLDKSISYVEQLMPKLKRSGIVSSKKGPAGGYWIDKKNVTVRDVVKSVYGDVFDCKLNSSLFAKLEELLGTTKISEMNKSISNK